MKFHTNTIRQGISIAILLLSLCYTTKNKFKHYTLALLAIAFHSSSVIMFLFIAKKIKLKTITLIYIVSIILYLLNVSLVTIAKVIFQYVPFIKNIDPRIGFWANGDALNYYGYVESGISGYIIINALLIICYTLISKIYSYLFINDFFIKSFILLSSLLSLTKDFPFPDRIGVFSWFLIPILFEPLLKGKVPVKYLYIAIMTVFFLSWSVIRSYY